MMCVKGCILFQYVLGTMGDQYLANANKINGAKIMWCSHNSTQFSPQIIMPSFTHSQLHPLSDSELNSLQPDLLPYDIYDVSYRSLLSAWMAGCIERGASGEDSLDDDWVN